MITSAGTWSHCSASTESNNAPTQQICDCGETGPTAGSETCFESRGITLNALSTAPDPDLTSVNASEVAALPSDTQGLGEGQATDEAPDFRHKSLRFAAAVHVVKLAGRHMKLTSSGPSDSSILWATQVAAKRRKQQLWQAPLDVLRAVSGVRRMPNFSHTQKRSSLREGGHRAWQRFKRRHVRFQGLPSAFTTSVITILSCCVRPGTTIAATWSLVMACVSVFDSILLPISLVAHEFGHSETHWRSLYDREDVEFAVSKHKMFTSLELWLDAVFVADIFFRASQAAVLDMGLADSSTDRIVDASAVSPTDDGAKPAQHAEPPADTYDKGFQFGPALRRQLLLSIPLRLFLMSPMWLESIHHMGRTFATFATLLRAYRILDVMAYFSRRQEDVATDVRWVAFFKFAYIIYLTGHWLGCMYYGVSAFFAFDRSQFGLNWVDAWVQQTNVRFDWLSSPGSHDYLVMLFKGFSVLTNLGYEVAVPQRGEEMLLSILAQNVKVVIDAYILGTLFHYLVKKDPELEATRDILAGLHQYCSDRGLSLELTSKMEAYLLFQQKHSSAISTSVMRSLPRSLQARVAQFECEATIRRNMHLFKNCNLQFLQRFMMTLAEVALMPDELIIKHGDMSRELGFAIRGTLVVTDRKGALVELLSGEGTAPCITGAVSFFLGVPEPNDVRARANENSAMLVATKANYDDAISHYPEQNDVILTNMLMQFGLNRKGDAMGSATTADQQAEAEGHLQLRVAIQRELQRCEEAALTELTYAASSGQIDVVQDLLARGLAIDAGDYDGRTTLHLAVADGQIDVVRSLLERGASVDVVDRWGSTPLLEALQLEHFKTAEALIEKGAAVKAGTFTLLKKLAENNPALLYLACDKAGGEINACDYDQRSLLHTLCAAGELQAVEATLKLGSDVNMVDRWGGMPLEDAIKSGDKMIVHVLKNHGAKMAPSFEQEALFRAARNDNIVQLAVLSAAGANFCAQDYDKMTALHVAAGAGKIVALYFLITEHASDVNRDDVWGMTPLDHAVRAQHLSCIVLLIANAGQCHHSEQSRKLGEILSAKTAPSLKNVRRSLSRTITHRHTELLALGTTMSQSQEAALEVRRASLTLNLKTLPAIQKSVDEVLVHLEDSHNLVAAMRTLMMLLSPRNKTVRTLIKQSSITTAFRHVDSAASSHGHILKMAMRVMMRSHTVEDMMHDLAQVASPVLRVFEPGINHVRQIFTSLGLAFDESIAFDERNPNAVEFHSLLHGAPGFKQLSLPKILTWPYFRDRVLEVVETPSAHPLTKVHGARMIAEHAADPVAAGHKAWTNLSGMLRTMGQFGASPADQEVDRETSGEDTQAVDVPADAGTISSADTVQIIVQLQNLYTWMTEMFSALDLQNINVISIAVDGQVIRKAFVSGDLEQLWHDLLSEADAAQEINPDRFMKVFVKWVGLEDTWAVITGLHRSCSRLVAAGGSKQFEADSDLDDALTMQAEMDAEALADLQEVAALDDLVALHGNEALKVVLQLSAWEQWRWNRGSRLQPQEIARRIYAFIDGNGNNSVSFAAAEALVRLLQSEFPLTKGSFDLLENLKVECSRDPTRTVGLEDFIAICNTIANIKAQTKLPPDASWRVCHPDAGALQLWDLLIRMVVLFFFWEVPVSIAFRSATRIGLLYDIGNQILEALLILDMFVNVSRAFYDDNGVLVYNLRAIRVRYINTSFFLDLVAAMPFSTLVQLNGNANHGYVSWLRLPKMLRTYRLLRLYRQLGRSVERKSVTMGILRLMPLILGLTHIYGCIWWYIGTVGRDLSHADVEDPADSWIYYYSGLGEANLWKDSVPITKQYIFSCYWAASTLSTASLVGDATPKNMAEILFTIWSMLTTLTVYAYVVGEISNMVMASDQALVSMREQMSRVQTFLQKHSFPRDLAMDIVSSFEDGVLRNTYSSEHINSLLSTNLRIEVAMQMSLPLLKTNHLFLNCTSGFTASLAALLRESIFASDEYLFRTNDVCNDLYILASSSVNILAQNVDGSEMARETKKKGDTIGELAFFFRLRHMHAACVGKTRAAVFALAYSDYKQLAVSYVDDDTAVLDALVDSVDSSKSEKSQFSASSVNTQDSTAQQTEGAVWRKVEKAVRRRKEQNVTKLLGAVAARDMRVVQHMLESEQVEVDESDYDDRTALHIAASIGSKSIVKILVERYNADTTVKDRYCGTPLDDAIRERHVQVVEYLTALQRCQNQKFPDERYTEKLIQAAADDDVQYVNTLLSVGMDANCADYDNRTPLHLAAANSSMHVLKCLVEYPQLQLGPVDNMGHTPLWDALCTGDHNVVELLQSRGAPVQPDIAEDLCKAAAANNASFFQLLSAHNIDMGSKDSHGRTALHVAATCGAIEVVSIICKSSSADVNPVDAHGSTPLDNANMVGDAAIAALLQDAGGLCGSETCLAEKVKDTREWVQQQAVQQQEHRRAEILADLPEQLQADAAAAVAQAQKEFVQAAFINLQILASALHEALTQNVPQPGISSGGAQGARIGEALQSLTAQLALLQDVLQGKVRAFSSLKLFPTRALSSTRVQQLSTRICEHISEVLPLMRHMGRRIRHQGLGIPPENIEPLKRMLSMGLLVYLKVPLPQCMTDDGLETSRVQTWSVSASPGSSPKRKEMQFLPRVS